MLPGFRFLIAATVLSVSMLIFGLGAAALLRAAHEEFVSIPSRRAPAETIFARRGDAMATLAILRAGEPAPDEAMVNAPETDDVQHVAPEQAAIVATPPEPEKPALESDRITALTDVEAPAENPSSPEMPTTEAFTPDIPVQADAPSPAGETTVAAIAEITPIAPSRAAVTTPDQPTAPADASTRIAETKIATLGGPPVAIDKPSSAPPKRAPAKVRKSAQVKPAVKRRRIVQRPRVARPMAAQQPANPFGSPWAAVPQAR